jgi:hypothetical protein
MSRGPGRIERAIEAAFAAEPDNAFNTLDLCEHAYPGVNRIDKKHRVAVLRALKRIMARRPDLETMQGDALGREIVVYHRYKVMSYAMGRLKSDNLRAYRSNDFRKPEHWITDEAELRASLSEGGKNHRLVVEGGAWWRHTQERIAERDGDHERAAQLRAENERAIAAIFAP